MFDAVLFMKVILVIAAVGSTICAGLAAALMYYYHFTPRGRLDKALMNLKGTQPVFQWRFVLVALVSWVALFCFN